MPHLDNDGDEWVDPVLDEVLGTGSRPADRPAPHCPRRAARAAGTAGAGTAGAGTAGAGTAGAEAPGDRG
ncbi:hypothetical protein [Spirillospora sp. NBC_01491]|uniref:hypothetical protein n=1 Tax=Spirillospora sp. NBC_01491 TaxID=2976007 RepID=UPI002E356BA6|nr:hypothetical protein [Spirillospora sp. NBC_01491]